MKNLVRKHSRKLTAAVCLLLAVKFNEVPKDSRLDALQVPPGLLLLSLPPILCLVLARARRRFLQALLRGQQRVSRRTQVARDAGGPGA